MKLVKVEDITPFELEIKNLFQKQPFGRFLSDRRIERANATNIEWDNLVNYSKKGIIILSFDTDSKIIGFIGFHFSQWDTDIFKKRLAFLQYFIVKETDSSAERKIAETLLFNFHDWILNEKIEVVITKLDTQYYSPIYILQKNGYIFYETITYQTLDASSIRNNIFEGIEYRFADYKEKDILKKISLENTFRKSHFYLDSMFEVKTIDTMYACWIENALNSSQKIVIIEDNKQIAGVFIYELINYKSCFNKKIGVWKSALVDTKFRNKGIGLNLFKAALHSCIKDGVDIIDSSLVEKNIVSQSFHNKLGFRLVNTQYTLHKWFN